MSSREIAELTGKRHDHVLRDCDNLNENYEKLGLPKVGEGYYTHPNTGSQQHREYRLTRMQTFDLLTGYNTELRIRVNRRWEELEQQASGLPKTYKEALLQLVAQEEEKERLMLKNKVNEQKLLEQQPKVSFAEAMLASNTSCLIGELAKVLTQNGYTIGQNRLFKWLRDNNYLCMGGERYNQPQQKYIEQGLFEIKHSTRSGNDGVQHIVNTPKVTPKGQQYFINKLLHNVKSA